MPSWRFQLFKCKKFFPWVKLKVKIFKQFRKTIRLRRYTRRETWGYYQNNRLKTNTLWLFYNKFSGAWITIYIGANGIAFAPFLYHISTLIVIKRGTYIFANIFSLNVQDIRRMSKRRLDAWTRFVIGWGSHGRPSEEHKNIIRQNMIENSIIFKVKCFVAQEFIRNLTMKRMKTLIFLFSLVQRIQNFSRLKPYCGFIQNLKILKQVN